MYSFDVYDTIITRKVYEPRGIWELMSFYLLEESSMWGGSISFKMDFAYIRMDAELQARKNRTYEVTLDDIYDVIRNNYNLSDEMCTRLKCLEEECEINNTIIIQENIDKIKKIKNSGGHVVLISDMYLPKAFFEELFDKICPELNSLRLYLSCDIGVTKASGLMYEYVSKEECVDYSEWIHEGDNIVSDINVPELYGISTVYYNRMIGKSYIERMGYVLPQSSPIFRQYLLGLVKNMNSQATLGYRIGYGFVGIALYAYVEWILHQAMKRNIKRLYFIARDGYVLRQIADVIIEVCGLDIKTSYLYGSRKAWRVEDAGQRDIVYRYLQQEFENDYSSMALVDTQGTGRSVEFLSDMVGQKLAVFYYALLGSMEERNIVPICFSTGVIGSTIEVLCRAPHGSTEGYVYKDGKIVPELKWVNREVYEKADLFSYFAGIKDFAKDFAILSKGIGKIPKGNITEAIVKYCLNCPDRELAEFLGNIPFDGDNENEIAVYAPHLTKERIFDIELGRTTETLDSVYEGVELSVSYSRLDAEERAYLQSCKQRFLEKSVDKSSKALKVVIYGFGKLGKELYHRMHLSKEIDVVDVVDINYQKFEGMLPIVNPIKNVIDDIFDVLVITLYDEKVSGQIKRMLLSAGMPGGQIVSLKEFERDYEAYYKCNSTNL